MGFVTADRGFPGGSDCKDSDCNAKDPGSIPESGISPGEGNGIHSSIPACRIAWTEEPGRLQSMGHKELGMTEWLTLLLQTTLTETGSLSKVGTLSTLFLSAIYSTKKYTKKPIWSLYGTSLKLIYIYNAICGEISSRFSIP